MNIPKAHFTQPILHPEFLKDDCFLNIAFGCFLWELQNNFTPIIPSAEHSLQYIVCDIFEAFYQYIQSTQKIELMDQGLWVEPVP